MMTIPTIDGGLGAAIADRTRCAGEVSTDASDGVSGSSAWLSLGWQCFRGNLSSGMHVLCLRKNLVSTSDKLWLRSIWHVIADDCGL